MTIYDIFFLIFSIAYLPYLAVKGKAHKDFMQRFGRLPEAFSGISEKEPIWVHAVSVGEVLATKNLLERLKTHFPGKKIVLSTTTTTGNILAKKVLGEKCNIFYFPLDFSLVVRKVISILNPSILIIMETEIWPNLLLEISKHGKPIVLSNGRISDGSFKGYRKIKPLFRPVLDKIDLFCMQTKNDRDRVIALGAPEKRVRVTGNMKFDVKIKDAVSLSKRIEFGLSEKDKLLIAGSTHKGEEKDILYAYERLTKKYDDLKLIIAPRHIDNVGIIKKHIEDMGLEAALISEVRKSPVLGKDAILILDTFGELGNLYSLATIVFVGGSLVKRGGHNLVEPAMFGKAILFGPFMHNFRDMANYFLERKAAIRVNDRTELFEALDSILSDEDRAERLGSNAKKLIEGERGATERNIQLIKELWRGRV